MNDQDIEDAIQEKGLTAPRITLDLLKQSIVKEEYHLFEDSGLTICVLTLKNNFTVTGESACVSIENFDEHLGQVTAKEKAENKIWTLLGFSLAEQLSNTPCVTVE